MLTLLCVALMGASAAVYASAVPVVAYWNFEDGLAGQPFTPEGAPNGSGGSVDVVNGYLMRGWDNYWGPSWTDDTPTGVGLAMRNAEHHQDGYTLDAALNQWSPAQWTIEAAVKLVGGIEDNRWSTFIGKDGSADGGVFSGIYFQKTWDNFFRIDFATAGGERYDAVSTFQMEADKWYRMAATSDGSVLKLWINDSPNDPGAWILAAETVMTGADNGMALVDSAWTFGRGWYNGGFVDHIDGYMDDIRFTEAALTPTEFIPEPATLVLLGMGGLALLKRRS